MSPSDQHEEKKVQDALALIQKNPGMKAAEAARTTRASYWRLTRRLRGIPRSSSRGGHNKKLEEPETKALREYLLMCHTMGRGANIDNTIAAANSILRYQGAEATASKRWAKAWLSREHEFLKTLRSKPLEAKRRASHIKEKMEDHFKEFRRCKEHWHILDEDIYNFDETGYLIGVVSGSFVIVPIGCEAVYVDDPANRELVTSTECISAGGHHVPPMIIFKGAYHLRKYFKNDMNGGILWARSDTGFTNDKLTLKWLKHFDEHTAARTLGRYRMLIFDGFGSHVTQNFINYCWEHRIRPYQLIPHSTHLTQPLDVGAFQKAKYEFKKLVREEIFHGATEITKTDFFSIFNKFSAKTFTSDLCKAAFRKAGLIPFDPSIVLSKMKEYRGIQDERREESTDDESIGFATPPPPPWHEFTTPITNTGRRRGIEYVKGRMLVGSITPTAIRVFEKIDKATDLMLVKGQLSTELLAANNAKEKERRERNDAPNKVVQKYGEIYGHQARRQIEEDEREEALVVNMREKRLRDPWKKRYKAIIKNFPELYENIRSEGRFERAGTNLELGLD
jgi:DDE superfamily endonuclease